MHPGSASLHWYLPRPIFYGWVVWGVVALVWVACMPSQTLTVSLFMDQWIVDFNLDRTTISGLFGLGTFVGSLSLTWLGRQIDRYGNRRTGMIFGILFALTLFGWALVDGPLALLVGFIFLRGLGLGALTLHVTTTIGQWFRRRRGQMMGLALVVFYLMQSLYAPWLQQLLETTSSWRDVWPFLGAVSALLILPATLIWHRNRPEEMGLRPDGVTYTALDVVPADVPEDEWTLGEAQHTFIFWIFLMGRFISPAWGAALILHQVSLFSGAGYDARIAAETFALASVNTAIFALVFGVLIDRLRPGWVMALQLSAFIVTMFCALALDAPIARLAYGFSMGVMMGGGSVFDSAVWANLFGRQHQGAIRGFVSTVLVTATASGPILFGLSYDYTGSYDAIILIGIALGLIPLVLSLFTNKPRHRWTALRPVEA